MPRHEFMTKVKLEGYDGIRMLQLHGSVYPGKAGWVRMVPKNLRKTVLKRKIDGNIIEQMQCYHAWNHHDCAEKKKDGSKYYHRY